MIGCILCAMGLACALAGILLEGISIEFPGIMLGGLGYYFCLTSQDPLRQTLGIFAATLNSVSMGVSGLEGPPK